MKILFNDDWQFLEEGNCWKTVTVPHTPKIENVDVGVHFQGKSYYKKTFVLNSEDIGKRLVLEFEAIMQYCEIKLNGAPVCKHYGGYLPVYVDVSDIAVVGENTVEVMADNSDDPDIPPGKPLDVLDFCYFGGIYRNVWLHKTDKLFITLPVMKNKVAGGGIVFATPSVNVSEASARVIVNVENAYGESKNATVKISLSFKGREVFSGSRDLTVKAGADEDAEFNFTVDLPKLWSPEHPHLYDLTVELVEDGKVIEVYEKRVGIRSVRVENGKFFLNGKAVKLYGTNRHQSFPYLGNAVSDLAHYRDMCLMKEMGCNFVRLCHYPQSESSLDACDELGIMVTEPVPGWQWFRNTEQFKKIGIENARQMVLRDRNHPSIVFWEATLNESHDTPKEFCKDVVDAIRAEFPYGDCLVSGDSIKKDTKFIGFDISHPTDYRFIPGMEHKKGLPPAWNGIQYYREYGDWDYGGNYSTSRKGREDGEVAMLLACWNQWYSYNSRFNLPEIIGMANWVGIDYNRGYCPEYPICKCGSLDTFRQKKFQFEMMRSQGSSEAMVFIASYWASAEKSKKIVVFSNCDEVELVVNGCPIEKRRPARGVDEEYKIKGLYADPYYWIDGTDAKDLPIEEYGNNAYAEKIDPQKIYDSNLMWDGNCAKNAIHPYFVFDNVPYQKGYVEAIGYVDGKEVARHRVNSFEKCKSLEIVVDDQYAKLKADDNDFVFVNARAVDGNGNLDYGFTGEVEFTALCGEIIGPSTVNAIAGVATVLVKATADVTVEAKSGKMQATTIIETVK